MELLRFNYISGEDVLSDGQIHNLYYGLMSEVIDEQSPSFSPETQPIEISPASPDLFSPPSSSAARDLLNLAAAAERAAAATIEVNTGAASALSALAAAANVMVRNPTNERPTTTRAAAISTSNPSTPRRVTSDSNGARSNQSTPRRGTNDSNGSRSNQSTPRRATNDSNGPRSNPSTPRRATNDSNGHRSSPSATRSNSSSPYYGEISLCVVCTDEMINPGVTDGLCNHRSTCTQCLRRILFYADGPALCPLCREPYYHVY